MTKKVHSVGCCSIFHIVAKLFLSDAFYISYIWYISVIFYIFVKFYMLVVFYVLVVFYILVVFHILVVLYILVGCCSMFHIFTKLALPEAFYWRLMYNARNWKIAAKLEKNAWFFICLKSTLLRQIYLSLKDDRW